ncbi:MAG: hypothetical protein OSB02_00440 [Rhodospirillaceae bacterium]|nr:hypothetical protein [Rhodospirillaceae bacterium]
MPTANLVVAVTRFSIGSQRPVLAAFHDRVPVVVYPALAIEVPRFCVGYVEEKLHAFVGPLALAITQRHEFPIGPAALAASFA